ncbi:probable inactive receptor-like protein kinase At3g56050 [Euphorbia lathyris]|uniref:probable inactive receptor-like protein kinase At3g56050 n=1 Tax=Euphorbia lathyris TaxID=212925 RepID=UPI003313BF1F
MDKRNWKFSRLGVLLLFLLHQNLILCWSLNDEGLALLKFREKIESDPYDALENWKDEDGVFDPCSWHGVECSDGRVVILNLKDLCLHGTVASDLRNLGHIKSIILRNNSFTGTIPEGLGELKELEVLDLGYNDFRGLLPSDLGNNLSLTILLLDNNRLLGNLAPEVHQLKMFSEFQVDENQLSGGAKESCCNRRSITRNVGQTENGVNRRILQFSRSGPPSPYARTRFFVPFPPMTPSPPLAQNPPSIVPSSPDPNITAPSPSPAPSPEANVTSLSPNASSSNSLPSPTPKKSSSSKPHIAIIAGAVGASALAIISIASIYFCKVSKSAVKPWATGLSGQLQKAFVTGVPNLKRSELEAGCEDFSNVIGSSPIGSLYKGTLSSGVEIAVASVEVTSSNDWTRSLELQFRKKIETLSKVNHKNFVNLIGYCEEEQPFTRMLVFEYAPNGTLFEHLHIKESEHLDWGMRLRIAMGMAYCLEHMHQLNPLITHNNLSSSAISLTEDYAAKISDLSFSNVITAIDTETSGKKFLDAPTADPEANVYSFGVLLFEILTGRLPYTVDNESLQDWASDYLRGDQPLKEKADPTLESFDEKQMERIGEVIKSCVQPDPKRRPPMREITAILREITGIAPDAATPKLSPLWWAELEIMSPDAS